MATQDSNPGSLSRESAALAIAPPLRHYHYYGGLVSLLTDAALF